jgi:hypothetical protein
MMGWLQIALYCAIVLALGAQSLKWPVAVGTAIARRPPHRSRRALLTHRAPTSGHDVEPPVGSRDEPNRRLGMGSPPTTGAEVEAADDDVDHGARERAKPSESR